MQYGFMRSIIGGLCLLSGLAFGQAYQWSNVAIGGGGFVTGVITSKTQANLMYARTDVGGAYRWDNTNGKWIPLLDWNSVNETSYQGVEALALDPQNSANLYMLAGTSYWNGGVTAILKSTDYGATFSVIDVSAQFKAHGNGMGRQNGERLAVDPNNGNILFCGSRENGLFKSTNAGASWTSVGALGVTTTPNGNGVNMIVYDPAGTAGSATQTFYVGVSRTGTNLYKTTNGGASFTAVAGAPTGLLPQRAVLASDKTLYVVYADNDGPWNIGSGQVWKCNTTTNTWTNITPTGFTTGFGGISVDPSDPNRIIASTVNAYWAQYVSGGNTVWGDRFLISTNGGTSWRDLVGAAGITLNSNGVTWIGGHSIHWAGCIEFNPFNTAQAHVISGNGVFTCDNVNLTNTTWKFNSIGLEETVPLDIASVTGGPLLSVIGDYDGFIHDDVTAFSPIHTPSMGTTSGIAFAALNTNVLLRTGSSQYYSTNQGTSWTLCSSSMGTQGKVAITANGSVFLHSPAGSSTTYRSTNNGTNWTTCNGINITDAMPVADMVNTNKIYAYNNSSGVMMVSTDGGVNFNAAGSPGTWGSKIIRTVPGQEGHIWVAMNGGGLKRSINSGTTFTTIANVSNCSAVGLGKADPMGTYHSLFIWGTVGGVTGVFRSVNEGASWTRINDDAHEFGGIGNGQFVIGDMNVAGRVYLSTVGRGIVYADPSVVAPVNLVSFEALRKSEQVEVAWRTVSEQNSSHFVLERSSDGQKFYEYASVPATGNSSTLRLYSFADENPLEGISFYRLKMVDADGTFTYSEIEKIFSENSFSAKIFPNPASHFVSVHSSACEASLAIYDVQGKLVFEKIVGCSDIIDLSGYTPGIYSFVFSDNKQTQVQTLIVE